MALASPQHIIIYSHGFGVRKSDRGLFTAIASSVPRAQSILFDYSPIHHASNTITVPPLTEQVLKLRKVIRDTRVEHPNAIVDLVCHSQGCIVAALLKPRDIRKIIMLTPPDNVDAADFAARLGKRSGTVVDIETTTRLPRADGSTTVIGPEFWQSMDGATPVKLFNRLNRFTALRIINARQDDVLGPVRFEGIDPGISMVTLDGDHNFSSEPDRARLLYILKKELALD